jgi:hypothetical protein
LLVQTLHIDGFASIRVLQRRSTKAKTPWRRDWRDEDRADGEEESISTFNQLEFEDEIEFDESRRCGERAVHG